MKAYSSSVVQFGTLWVLFMCMCFSLGFASFSRYDPRNTGLSDTYHYAAMVDGNWDLAEPPFRYRVLTPFLASQVSSVVKAGSLGSWDGTFLSLLLVNSVYVSTTGIIIIKIAEKLGQQRFVGLLAALLYFASYGVVNVHLAGMLCAGEAFFLALFVFVILQDLWWLAPLIMCVSVTAKETTLVFSAVFMVVWILWPNSPCSSRRRHALMWAAATIFVGAVVRTLVMRYIGGPAYKPHLFSVTSLLTGFRDFPFILFNRSVAYTFVYLLPLSILGRRIIPQPLLAAYLGMAMAAMFTCSYAGIAGNVSRPLFNTVGPLLAIACAAFLFKLLATEQTVILHSVTSSADQAQDN